MQFDGLAPALVWGLIPRFVGVLYILAFGALIPQHYAMPGGPHLVSVRSHLARLRRDFPGPRRYFRYPTLLWLNDSDTMLRAMPFVGVLCGAGAIYGGVIGTYCLALGFMLWLSLELRGLMFPWDTLLQEAGFLVLFLPTAEVLPNLHASALPLPSVAFMFRWLVLRLMLGFGKDKFIGSTSSDNLYLRGFMVWMPLPSPLGWFGHHAPAWFLRGSLYFMFFAEVIAPLLGFFAGPLRIVSFASLTALMLGIAATGNWGFFNYGYILLCVCLLDVHASLFDLGRDPWLGQLTHWPDVAVHGWMLVMFLVSIVYLPTNSWFTRAWPSWPVDLLALPRKWAPLVRFIHRALAPARVLAPFRIVNGYGVFPPNSLAPVRMLPVLEGSMDGVHFEQYGYRFMPSFADSRPCSIAPYHARLDQWTYYVSLGIDSSSLYGSLFPTGSPYAAGTRVCLLEIINQRIMANDRRILAMLGHNPFPNAPPKYMRVGLIGMTPTRPHELRATGRWWHVRRFGTYSPARAVASWPEKLFLLEPELFQPDFVDAKRRARPLRLIAEAYAAGISADRAVIAGSDLTAADVEHFWSEFVPLLAEHRGDWTRIHERAAAVSARYEVEAIHTFERIFERFAWLLLLRTDAHHYGTAQPLLPVMSRFRYHKLLQEIVLDGRAGYASILTEPAGVVARAERSNDASQLWAFTLMRYDQMMTHILVFRSTELGRQCRDWGMPGLFEYYELLATVVPPGEEFVPHPVKHANGEHTIEGFYPPPPTLV